MDRDKNQDKFMAALGGVIGAAGAMYFSKSVSNMLLSVGVTNMQLVTPIVTAILASAGFVLGNKVTEVATESLIDKNQVQGTKHSLKEGRENQQQPHINQGKAPLNPKIDMAEVKNTITDALVKEAREVIRSAPTPQNETAGLKPAKPPAKRQSFRASV